MKVRVVTAVAVALVLTACTGAEESTKVETVQSNQPAKAEEKNETAEYVIDRITGEKVKEGEELLDQAVVEKTEFFTLDEFVQFTIEAFEPDSEYRFNQEPQSADWTLANATMHYINYFEAEIEERGKKEEFDNLQVLAYYVVKNDDPEKHAALLKPFVKRFKEIAEEL